MLFKQLVLLLALGVSICTSSHNDSYSWLPDINTDPMDYEEYWDYDYWELPDDGRMCERGQELVTNDDGTEECSDCPAGTYNPRDARIDSCLPCEVGYYANSTGSTWCRECPWNPPMTTSFIGATDVANCTLKSERLDGAYLTTVWADVVVTGDLCSELSRFLYAASGLQFYEATFTDCSYDETEDESSISLQISPPTRFGMDIYYGLSIVESYREVINAYISLGQHYAEKVVDLANNSEVMEWFGLEMNIDQLDIENLRIVSFEAGFVDRCSAGYSVGDDGKCWEDNSEEEEESFSFYIYYSINAGVCGDNIGQTMARNYIEEWGIDQFLPYDCLADGSCTAQYVLCEQTGDEESVLVMKLEINSDYSTTEDYSFTSDWDLSSLGVDDVSVTWSSTEEGCQNGVEFSADYAATCLDSCEIGQYLDDAGYCVNCPFTTWSNNSESCYSCPWYTETPFWATGSADMCLETENWWKDETSNDDWLRGLAGRLQMSLATEPTMDFCDMGQAKQSMDDWCSEQFGDELDDDLDDVELGDLQEFVCYFSSNVAMFYDELCGDDFDMSWDDAIDNVDFDDGDSLLDVGCVVLRPLYDMEGEDLSDECAAIDNNVLNMPIEFDAEIESDGASLLVPLLTALENLETMDFSSLSDAMINIMERFGMYDMNALTGLDIANDLRDFGLAVPDGIDVLNFEFDVEYEESDFFCDSGEVRRDCYDWCYDWKCKKTDADWDTEIYCEKDECSNCASSWYYYNETSDVQREFECADCGFPDSIENGFMITGWGNGMTNAYYGCNDGYRLKDCNNYAWCDINNSSDISIPECIEDNCEFPDEIEYGWKSDEWTNSDNYYDSCAWAHYKCQDFYEIEGSNRADCYGYNETWIPTCVEACTFPLYIENGMNVQNYSNYNGKWRGEYECSSGYYTGGDWGSEARCYTDWQKNENGTWEQVVMTYVPTCNLSASCEFPDEYNGAYKDYETSGYDGQKYADYECYDDYRAEGSTWVECEGENRDEFNPEFLCIDEDRYCWYDWGAVENGWVESSDNNAVWFVCGDSYEMEGDSRAWCDDGEAVYPTCVEREPECELPDDIDNGWVAESNNSKKRYECNEDDGWKLADGSDGWAWCNGSEAVNVPECESYSCDFNEYIDNGEIDGTSGIYAWYYCYDGYRMENGDESAKCGADGSYWYPSCIESGDPCEFPDYIDNGQLGESYDYDAYYNCNDGYALEGAAWVYCNSDGDVEEWPNCTVYIECDFPDIENGYVDEDWGSGARYECEDGYWFRDDNSYAWCDTKSGNYWSLPECYNDDCDDCDDGVYDDDDNDYDDDKDDDYDDDDDEDYDDDDDGDYEYNYPDYIDKGYKVWEGEVEGTNYAAYRCYQPYAMQNAEIFGDGDYLEMYGVAMCSEDTSGTMQMYLPSCHYWYEVGYCGLSVEIDGGNAVNMTWFEDTFAAQYQCDEDRVMIETPHGAWGWCRGDGSMEMPRCASKDEYWNIEFVLDSNGYDLDNGGYVLARQLDGYGNEGDWEVACDDGVNDNAAGAVCRSLGARHGKKITPSKKMNSLDNATFGWTNVNCDYDDTLMASRSCSANRYGEEGTAFCTSDEQFAVQCYDTDWAVDMSLSVKAKSGKMECPISITKEDNSLKIKTMDLSAEFGSECGGNYTWFDVSAKMNKKGFKAKAKDDVKGADCSCFFCVVYSGGAELGWAWDC